MKTNSKSSNKNRDFSNKNRDFSTKIFNLSSKTLPFRFWKPKVSSPMPFTPSIPCLPILSPSVVHRYPFFTPRKIWGYVRNTYGHRGTPQRQHRFPFTFSEYAEKAKLRSPILMNTASISEKTVGVLSKEGDYPYVRTGKQNKFGGIEGVKSTGKGAPLPYGSTLFQVQREGDISSPEVKETEAGVLTKTKIKFSETKNKKLKSKIHYLHAFWRLNIGNLDFSLSTQLLLKKFGINSVYSMHYFILKKSTLATAPLFSKEQEKEIIKIYYKFGFNSPFIK